MDSHFFHGLEFIIFLLCFVFGSQIVPDLASGSLFKLFSMS